MNNSDLSMLQAPEVVAETQRNFMRRVYGWMTLGMVVTATASFFMLANPVLQKQSWEQAGCFSPCFGELLVYLRGAINKLTRHRLSFITTPP
jgi:FtsH-binding integral membrane protein